MFNKKWDEILKEEVSKEYYIKLRDFIDKEYNKKEIFPIKDDIFNALNGATLKPLFL